MIALHEYTDVGSQLGLFHMWILTFKTQRLLKQKVIQQRFFLADRDSRFANPRLKEPLV